MKRRGTRVFGRRRRDAVRARAMVCRASRSRTGVRATHGRGRRLESSRRMDGCRECIASHRIHSRARGRSRHRRSRHRHRSNGIARVFSFHARERRREARTRRVRVEHRRKRGCGSENGIIHSRRRTRDGTTQRTVFVRGMRTRRGGGWTRPRLWIRGGDRAHLSRV